MKLAIIGATGRVGSRLTAEALRRGHQVTAIARNPEKLAPGPGLTLVRGDLRQPEEMVRLLAGHDAVISAVLFQAADPEQIISAVKRSL